MSRANNRNSLNFECQRCGKCCSNHTIFVTIEDLRRWIKERRTDILKELVADKGFNQNLRATETRIEITDEDCLKLKIENEKQGIRTEDVLFLNETLGDGVMSKILSAMIIEKKYLKKENEGNPLRITDFSGLLVICPFLKSKYGKHPAECLIHDTKPKNCRDYFCERTKT